MRLSPPWHYMLKDLPTNGDDCYFVRFGQVEPPIQGTWELASLSFIAAISGEAVAINIIVVHRWRLVTP